MIYISNAFSFSMLDRAGPERTAFPITIEGVRGILRSDDEWKSVVGHADTARLFSNLLGEEIPCNRETIKLGTNDCLFVGQYIGPRLPPGATELPKDARIEWWEI